MNVGYKIFWAEQSYGGGGEEDSMGMTCTVRLVLTRSDTALPFVWEEQLILHPLPLL